MNSDITIVDKEKAEDISEVLFKSNTLIKSNINTRKNNSSS